MTKREGGGRRERRLPPSLDPGDAMPIRPKCWHVYIVDLEYRVRGDADARRACVVVQPDELAETGLGSTVVLSIATNPGDRLSSRVRIPAGACGLPRDSEVVVDEVLVCDNARFREDLGRLPDAVQDEIRSRLRACRRPA